MQTITWFNILLASVIAWFVLPEEFKIICAIPGAIAWFNLMFRALDAYEKWNPRICKFSLMVTYTILAITSYNDSDYITFFAAMLMNVVMYIDSLWSPGSVLKVTINLTEDELKQIANGTNEDLKKVVENRNKE